VAGSCEHGKRAYGFRKGRAVSRLAEELLASQEGLRSVGLVSVSRPGISYLVSPDLGLVTSCLQTWD
jgi:hypothetical protein